jgi:hypothetical protein
MADQSSRSDLERVAVTLSAGVHVVHSLWTDVQDDERVRGVVFSAWHTLAALHRGDPRAAGEALSKMDDARVRIAGDRP